MTPLTDEQIDELSGRELDEAVCISLGYTQIVPKVLPTVWQYEDDESFELCYSTDIGSAMDLLLSLGTSECGWAIDCCTTDSGGEVFEVYSELLGPPLASGPKEQAATLCCRAYLKLKNRSE